MISEVPVGGVWHHAHLPRRFTEHHGVRATGPGQFEPGGDQAVADGSSRTAPPLLRLTLLLRWSAGPHDDRVSERRWTASTSLVIVDSVHFK
jgi:hypothetical protein